MSALVRSRAALRRVMGPTPQRNLAAGHQPQVTWADYRSGQKTLAEWVDGNRHYVAFGFFCFYSSLAAWNLRPKKKPAANTDDSTPTPSAKH